MKQVSKYAIYSVRHPELPRSYTVRADTVYEAICEVMEQAEILEIYLESDDDRWEVTNGK